LVAIGANRSYRKLLARLLALARNFSKNCSNALNFTDNPNAVQQAVSSLALIYPKSAIRNPKSNDRTTLPPPS
jgi:hypothetical protein